MKCVESERRIHLYAELNDSERAELDLHIAGCAACSELFAGIMADAGAIRRMFNVPDVPPNQAALTGRIMQRIELASRARPSLFDMVLATVFPTPVRYAMVVISLTLMATFIDEYNTSPPPGKKGYRQHSGVQLNSVSFLWSAEKRKKAGESPSLYRCVLECLKSGDDSCAGCKSEWIKLNEHHEEG